MCVVCVVGRPLDDTEKEIIRKRLAAAHNVAAEDDGDSKEAFQIGQCYNECVDECSSHLLLFLAIACGCTVLFPHIYGPITPPSCVVRELPVVRDEHGAFLHIEGL